MIVFAGPGVAGAIRNQFNLVTNTLNSGTDGDDFLSEVEKDYLNTMQSVVAKDAKDWTLDDQETAALDIAKHGTSSVVYAKAKAAMDAGTKFTMKITNGQTLEYRIIGINHDDLADGSGKAGLTFMTTSTGIKSRFNAGETNAGGWEKSELRAKMNSGEIWNLMPSDFQSKVKPVRKLTNNVGGGDENKNAAVTATADKLFLLSNSEIVETPNINREWSKYPWFGKEGTQYEAFQGKVANDDSDCPILAIGGVWWERSAVPDNDLCFLNVLLNGNPSLGASVLISYCVCPAWCF
ncbi:MAG: DUF6273 domain-containing protein [Collinsella sp.]|nr:DUF6273 domain-containing protein [Collinsella sp.]